MILKNIPHLFYLIFSNLVIKTHNILFYKIIRVGLDLRYLTTFFIYKYFATSFCQYSKIVILLALILEEDFNVRFLTLDFKKLFGVYLKILQEKNEFILALDLLAFFSFVV